MSKAKHAVITGASSGIGAALAKELGRRGYRLTLVARRRALLEEIAEKIGGQTLVVARDLGADPDTSWLKEVEAEQGPIDVFVNNAGVHAVNRFEDHSAATAQRMIDVNLHAPLRLSRALVPEMVRRGSGTIVDVASVAAFAPTPFTTHYNASKAALAAASESMRGELRGTGVRVLTVYPGPIDTPMAARAKEVWDGGVANIVPFGKPEVLARRIANGIERGWRRIVYPRFYWLARWFPDTTRVFMDRFTPVPAAPALLPATAGAATTDGCDG